MKITEILKKDSKTVAVHLDNEQILYLNYELFLKSSLRKNDEVSGSRFDFLVKENQRFAVKQRAFRYLARRLHSENEMRIKLKQKRYQEDIIEETINELKEKNYINDYEFAVSFSEENLKNKLWGKNKIKAELIKRGINNIIINEVLENLFPEGNDLENAVEVAQKKYKALIHRKFEERKLKEKLYSYLLSKGYDYEIIKEAVDKLLQDDDNSFT